MRFYSIRSSKIYEFLMECEDLGIPWNFMDTLSECTNSDAVIEKLNDGYGDQFFSELKKIAGNISYHYTDIHAYKATFFSETIIRRVVVFDIDPKDINLLKLSKPKTYSKLCDIKFFEYRAEEDDDEEIHAD